MTAMKLLPLFIVAFQVLSVVCSYDDDYHYVYEEREPRSCHRPERISQPPSDIKRLCVCDGAVNPGEVCHCHTEYTDREPSPLANQVNKVQASLRKKLCWENVQATDHEDRFYENCAEDAERDCLFEDRIEICYTDDIDAAQALCRHFNKGDAYRAEASALRKLRARTLRNGRRTSLVQLQCNPHPQSLEDCRLRFLPSSTKECRQMVARCWLSPCWQPQHIIRATVGKVNDLGTGAVIGQLRYGQACKLGPSLISGICGRACFGCPEAWTGNRFDGTRCFTATGQNIQERLQWGHTQEISIVNGGFGSWGSWSSCSLSCGGGTQSHSRQCNNPTPANGGRNCVGSSTGSRSCNTGGCPASVISNFQLLSYYSPIPRGWSLASKSYVEANKDAAIKVFDGATTWTIAALQDDFQFRGAGYGYDITDPFPGQGFDNKVIRLTDTNQGRCSCKKGGFPSYNLQLNWDHCGSGFHPKFYTQGLFYSCHCQCCRSGSSYGSSSCGEDND